MEQRRIAVAMSGGVDSSVAAALLVEQSEDVFGLMMRLWSATPDGPNRCCSPIDITSARQVAARLSIPFYVINAQETFKEHVVDPFVNGYTKGITPNPCIECNRHVRWGFLMRQASAMGATHLATGHYAQSVHREGRYRLLRAKDPLKDQSYVLYMLGQQDLSRTIFPVGPYTKQEVREHARRLDLHVAERPDSQDLCFVSTDDYRAFLKDHGTELPPPGAIVDRHGNTLGQHEGLAEFTIGQRRRIGLSSPAALYVLEKDLASNRLVVGPREELGRREFNLRDVCWTSDQPPTHPLEAHVRVRYKAQEIAARVHPKGADRANVSLDSPLPDVTPGQSTVFYDQDECLGGGIIES
jgi:tRNA-specific 2-thiouridylase